MPKNLSPNFSCTKCDAQLLKWAGQCPECHAWGTVVELEAVPAGHGSTKASKPSAITSFSTFSSSTTATYVPLGVNFCDRILGGGIVPGSVTLIGGEPGIGKSTLLAQIGLKLASQGKKVLYVTGEESPSQVHLRLKRLSPEVPSSFHFLDVTQADMIAATIEKEQPALTIVDSIQTIRLPSLPGEMGNPTQIKASAATISEAAKRSQSPVFLIGQVNKDGDLAGPRLLEHLVDTVVMMEGDRNHAFRLLRVLKHRFGTTEESAILEMAEQGLIEVLDPSAALVADRPKGASGTIITCLCEGSRAVLVELQALVTPAGFGIPSRRSTGIDTNRLGLLLAVLARRAGLSYGDHDVFANAVGGIEAKDPSIDLALALALASAKQDRPLKSDTAAWGEIGLAGEIRPVPNQERRIKEALRLGFSTLIIPPTKKIDTRSARIVQCSNLREAIKALE